MRHDWKLRETFVKMNVTIAGNQIQPLVNEKRRHCRLDDVWPPSTIANSSSRQPQSATPPGHTWLRLTTAGERRGPLPTAEPPTVAGDNRSSLDVRHFTATAVLPCLTTAAIVSPLAIARF